MLSITEFKMRGWWMVCRIRIWKIDRFLFFHTYAVAFGCTRVLCTVATKQLSESVILTIQVWHISLRSLFAAYCRGQEYEYIYCNLTETWFSNEPPFETFPLPNCETDVEPTYDMYTWDNRDEPQTLDRNNIP